MVVGNDHFCDTAKRASQRLTPHIKGEIPLYHRSGNKPLDSTTLILGKEPPPPTELLPGFFRTSVLIESARINEPSKYGYVRPLLDWGHYFDYVCSKEVRNWGGFPSTYHLGGDFDNGNILGPVGRLVFWKAGVHLHWREGNGLRQAPDQTKSPLHRLGCGP